MNHPLASSLTTRPRPPRILAVILLLVGLVLGIGGLRLAAAGGSFYYVITGVVLSASAILLWRGDRWGAYLYGLLTFGTVIWAVAEAGFDGWALAPRILPFLVLGLLLLRPRVRRALFDQPRPLFGSWITRAALASLLAICVGVALREPYPTLPFPASIHASTNVSDWQHWGGSAAGRRYAALDQINTANVSKLQVAWTFRTG